MDSDLLIRVERLERLLNGLLNASQVDPQMARTIIKIVGEISLSELNDVTISSPTTGQVLKYNGTNWYNGTDEIV